MDNLLGELLGTMFLIILGDGVVANVLLAKSKGNNSWRSGTSLRNNWSCKLIVLVETTTVRSRLAAYLALTKPRIIELLLITTLPAMVLAEGGWRTHAWEMLSDPT